jgi:hypothetical protein
MATSSGSNCPSPVGEDELCNAFLNPSDAARPHTFWHWLNGNVTKEGITADLEAMAHAGIGGVFLFIIEGHVIESVPLYVDKPIRYLTPEWFAMLRHSAEECKRLNLEFSLMICPGWTTAGGPWVPVEQSMMRIAWSEKYIQGPAPLADPLPLPPCDYANYQNLTKNLPHIHESVPPEKRFYRDIAVLAYRMNPTAAKIVALGPPKLSCSGADQNPQQAIDGDGATAVAVKENGFVRLDFSDAVTVRGVEYLGDGGELQASTDGATWQKIADLPWPRAWGYPQNLTLPEIKAQSFRIVFPKGGTVRNIKLSGDALVRDYGMKASFHSVWEDIKVAEDRIGEPTPAWALPAVQAKDVLNLTPYLRPGGSLDWAVPEGEWMIVRLGYAPTGRLNGPSAREYRGLECDKLDAAAVETHFNGYPGRVAEELKDLIGSGFHAIHVDSWEAGDINFTPNFLAEFQRLRGYDPTPYLLVHGGGRIVDSPAVADRFLWDVRRTIADLITENYSRKLTELCHKHELKFQGMVGGVMIQATIDVLQTKGQCDIPLGEFQTPNCVYGDSWARWDCVETASTAHTYGKTIAGAEAFVTFDRWLTDPYGLKGIGDLAFANGINRYVFHTWAHHPFLDRAPGMTMGPFGVNFSRMNTWWGRPAKVYFDYLRRCQGMLQQGRYVADILYFYGEGAPNTLPMKPLIKPALPDGYAYDGCDADILYSRIKVKDGLLMLPDGMSYRVLVLKEDPCMTPKMLARIGDLVKAGATVIGLKPQESPSLKDYPHCDAVVRKLADEVWDRVIWGPSVGEVLKSMNIGPDIEIKQHNNVGPIEWIHRRQGDADIYFITNQQSIIDHGSSLEIWERRYDSYAVNELEKDTARFDVAFRMTGKQPELWDAVWGTQCDLPEFRIENGRTIVPFSLPPSGSCFIVFRRALSAQTKSPGIKNFPELKPAVEINGPWTVAFDPKWGGPAKATFDTLEDWTKRTEPGIKYYSGRATYTKTFDAGDDLRTSGTRVFLDLGTLRSLAEVRLNGKDLGVLWCPPWRVEITGLLKPNGNELQIDIVNMWANRVIGDLDLPPEKRFTWTSLGDTISAFKPGSTPLVPSGLCGPVKVLVELSAGRG